MKFLYVILILGFLAFVFNRIAKVLLKKIEANERLKRERQKELSNPYIGMHKFKERNDKKYEEYLEWLSKKENSGVPLEKFQSLEDQKADKKIKGML